MYMPKTKACQAGVKMGPSYNLSRRILALLSLIQLRPREGDGSKIAFAKSTISHVPCYFILRLSIHTPTEQQPSDRDGQREREREKKKKERERRRD